MWTYSRPVDHPRFHSCTEPDQSDRRLLPSVSTSIVDITKHTVEQEMIASLCVRNKVSDLMQLRGGLSTRERSLWKKPTMFVFVGLRAEGADSRSVITTISSNRYPKRSEGVNPCVHKIKETGESPINISLSFSTSFAVPRRWKAGSSSW